MKVRYATAVIKKVYLRLELLYILVTKDSITIGNLLQSSLYWKRYHCTLLCC